MIILSFLAAHLEILQGCLLYKQALSQCWRQPLCHQNCMVNHHKDTYVKLDPKDPEYHDVEQIKYFYGQPVQKDQRSKDQKLMETRRNSGEIDFISTILQSILEEGALLQTFKIARYSAISLYPPFLLSSSTLSPLSLTIISLHPVHTMQSRARAFGSEMTNSLREILVGVMELWMRPVTLSEGALQQSHGIRQFGSLCYGEQSSRV